jgi:hypothetical protein
MSTVVSDTRQAVEDADPKDIILPATLHPTRA